VTVVENVGAEGCSDSQDTEMIGGSIRRLSRADRPGEEDEVASRGFGRATRSNNETIRCHKDGSEIRFAMTVSPTPPPPPTKQPTPLHPTPPPPTPTHQPPPPTVATKRTAGDRGIEDCEEQSAIKIAIFYVRNSMLLREIGRLMFAN